jgi:hypothetical protein
MFTITDGDNNKITIPHIRVVDNLHEVGNFSKNIRFVEFIDYYCVAESRQTTQCVVNGDNHPLIFYHYLISAQWIEVYSNFRLFCIYLSATERQVFRK